MFGCMVCLTLLFDLNDGNNMNTPKSLRLHISVFGRRNVGKSSLLNALTHQTVSIVSEYKGTTTDPVEKPMELPVIGPVVLIDTAGLDDEGELGALRVERTRRVYDRTDLGLIVTDGVWGEFERSIRADLDRRNIPWIAVLNQCDRVEYGELKQVLSAENAACVQTDALNGVGMEDLLEAMIRVAPSDYLETSDLAGDLVPEGGHVLLVIPIDREAPKGRLILPQVQTIRDLLDHRVSCSICREDRVGAMIDMLRSAPSLVVTDSQVFGVVSEQVPRDIMLTGFSVLFARYKGDLVSMAKGAAMISRLKAGDRVLIAEACTHHPIQDDIGRVKIPGWLQKHVEGGVEVDFVSGQEFPKDLSRWRLIIHCGACMWTRRQMLERIRQAREQGVAITNYGLAIAGLHGILDRALEPFPEALRVWQETMNRG